MGAVLEKHIEMSRRCFTGHELVLELQSPAFTAYLMRDPAKGRIDSVRILFTPSGIVLSGDHTPGRYGNVSCAGYDERWFGQRQGAYYLAEKFLDKTWVSELANEELLAGVAEEEASEPEYRNWTDEQRAAVKEMLPCVFDSAYELVEWLEEIELRDRFEDLPGHDYEPRELACLVAINERFAELWQARQKNWEAECKRWMTESERYRMLIDQSMEKYSQQLGWGLTGAQAECWIMLDIAIARLVKLEAELPKVATLAQDYHRYFEAVECKAAFTALLQRMGELGIKPFADQGTEPSTPEA